jgi:hypothetical protein
MKQEHRFRALEKRMPRRIYANKTDEITGGTESYAVWSFIVSTFHQILLWLTNQGR